MGDATHAPVNFRLWLAVSFLGDERRQQIIPGPQRRLCNEFAEEDADLSKYGGARTNARRPVDARPREDRTRPPGPGPSPT